MEGERIDPAGLLKRKRPAGPRFRACRARLDGSASGAREPRLWDVVATITGCSPCGIALSKLHRGTRERALGEAEITDWIGELLAEPGAANVVLQLDSGERRTANRELLMAQSGWFEGLLADGEPEVRLSGVGLRTLEGLLEWVSSASLARFMRSSEPEPAGELLRLMVWSELVGVNSLASRCEEALEGMVELGSVCWLLNHLVDRPQSRLKERCLEFVAAHRTELHMCGWLDELDKRCIIDAWMLHGQIEAVPACG